MQSLQTRRCVILKKIVQVNDARPITGGAGPWTAGSRSDNMAYRSIGKAQPRSGGPGGGKPVRKFFLIILTALFLTSVNPTHAQQTGKVLRIGFLDPSTASGSAVLVDAFRQELSKLGWIEGKNITIEYRFAEQKH